MHFKAIVPTICLLGSAAASAIQPYQIGNLPYLAIRQDNSSANASITSIADVANLCALGPPGNDNITEATGPATVTCSDCITVSGQVVGTAVPSDLIPTNQTASFEDNSNNKRAALTHMPRATLMPRAIKPVPLAEPDANGQEDFIETLRSAKGTITIGIVADESQLDNWKISITVNGVKTDVPIGVTGIYIPWPTKATNYKMVGMHGCTGVIIVGNSGFWAGHFWESSKATNVNGGSSHIHRYGSNPGDAMVRPVADFQKVAANILGTAAPAAAVSFTSLLDLQTSHGDPFGRDNGGGNVYIITKAAGSSKAQLGKQLYKTHIDALITAIRKYVRPNDVEVQTYIGADDQFTPSDADDWTRRSPAGVPYALNGVSIVQYSPYAGDTKENCHEARARVFGEINPKPAIDRKWASTAAGLSKRDGAACALPVASSSTSAAAAVTTPKPCYAFEDPDSGMKGGLCSCNNGAKISMVTGNGDVCPWTTLPPQALTTAKPTTTANLAQYQYTYTDASKKVIECQTYSVQYYAGYPVSYCVGSSAVIYEPPVASMELGSSKVNVGTSMTGEVLYTSVYNALMSLCPTPTSSGAWTSCSTGTVNVGKASFIENGKPTDGDVTLKVPDAQYDTPDMLNLFLKMAAGAANASASGKNCNPIDWSYTTEVINDKRDHPFNSPHVTKGTDIFCNINGFFDTQFYDGVQQTATKWFETEFGFKLGELGNLDCGGTVGVVAEVMAVIFDAILPEFAWLITTGVVLGKLACEAAENFNPTRSLQDRAMDAADANLAKAWKKELKKDRKLPMPEHKKRELGLIDS